MKKKFRNKLRILDSPSEEYPNMIYRLLFDGMIKSIALNWIEENVPMAWYKPMFV